MAESGHSGQEPRALARLRRDAVLHRLVWTRRWVAAGAAVLTAGFAALAQAATTGRSSSAGAKSRAGAPAPRSSRSSAASVQLPPEASPSQLGLQPPSQAPQSAPSLVQSAPAPAQPSPVPDPSVSQASPSGGSGGGGAVVSGGS